MKKQWFWQSSARGGGVTPRQTDSVTVFFNITINRKDPPPYPYFVIYGQPLTPYQWGAVEVLFCGSFPCRGGLGGGNALEEKIRKESRTSTAPFRCNNVDFGDIIFPIQATWTWNDDKSFCKETLPLLLDLLHGGEVPPLPQKVKKIFRFFQPSSQISLFPYCQTTLRRSHKILI